MLTATDLSKKSMAVPDEVREFDRGRLELVTVADMEFARAVFQPGWRWSESVRPLAGTESCRFPHRLFVEAGALHIRMDDGAELDITAGDVVVIGPGHDAWVTSTEPCVVYEFRGEDSDYAKTAD
ncbi:hypothetical protein FHX37_3473 [Haloactinospora alba]|uniref:Cupin n=1 Tax=Haloactinospora alba TaxID=405555 RepID=A0A543NNP3_9ACTN|nr:cupin domain-containing protein [Haloactinospora alba]TQN33454.1 hypothetical protein FHX37_3473 [Haloactinospora alba]